MELCQPNTQKGIGILTNMVTIHNINQQQTTTQMKNKLFLVALLMAIAFASCEQQQNEDVVKQPEKDGSIELVSSTVHIDAKHDVLKLKYTVWLKGSEYKTFVQNDTIPSLGITTEQADTDSTDENGDEVYERVELPKDYQFFITVK